MTGPGALQRDIDRLCRRLKWLNRWLARQIREVRERGRQG